MKWVDNANLAETVRLDRDLVKSADPAGPRDYHDHHGWVLVQGKSKIQERLNQINQYVTRHYMKVNTSKMKVMPINFSSKYDFKPRIMYNNQLLDITHTEKILGVICNSKAKWNDHIEYIVRKARKRTYFLRRLKALGFMAKY